MPSLDGDCDDADPSIHPDATEVCNLVDDDCDTETDEGATTTDYLDFDTDGYGAAATTTQACSLPLGYSRNGYDCDDTNNGVNPGAFDIVFNRVDEDGSGQVFSPVVDGQLEACIPEETGGSMEPADVISLTSLDCSYQAIRHIEGLQHLTSLRNLYLYNNAISELSPRPGFTSLYYLNLRENPISDPMPISRLPSPSCIYLGTTRLTISLPLRGSPRCTTSISGVTV